MGVIEEARKLRRLIESMAENLDDETAEENVNVFPKWQEGVLYEVGYKVRYNDVLYKVIQEHTSQSRVIGLLMLPSAYLREIIRSLMRAVRKRNSLNTFSLLPRTLI